jgi:hypothetical protein
MSVDAGAGNEDGYAASVGALTALIRELPADPPVTAGRMFNGDGVQVRGRFFAFIGRNGDLIAKLPAARVRELVSQQAGTPVVMGARTMREWVRLPVEAGMGSWSVVLGEAYGFVSAGAPG